MILVADEHLRSESTTIMEQAPRTKINLTVDRLAARAGARVSACRVPACQDLRDSL
jgi:hypothetical protein